ncbi:hypothetical protein IL306_005838 [Fusarium sp. DS 682]|nr:hypothetical protein IL306_005838 [Fusarium sp. DS 682]
MSKSQDEMSSRKPGRVQVRTLITKTKKASTISPNSAPSRESPLADAGAHIAETEDDANNLQPSGLLNHQALEGRFSLGNILNADQCPVQRQRSRDESLEDPIELGLITPSLAKSLFDSISLQTGRPWMIECNEFIESIESWCNDPLVIENDRLLGAFTTLRLLTSVAFPLLVAKSQQGLISHHESAPLVSLLNGRIERWEKTWTQKVIAQQEPTCHEFLIRFYGTHLRLQLHTLPLHDILASHKSNINHHIDTIWVAYSSALNMLQLISQFSEYVCFAQDSIHVMTAYSAAFLTKVGYLVFLPMLHGT